MSNLDKHLISLRNGMFDSDNGRNELRQLVQAFTDQSSGDDGTNTMVLHFHGGLVNEASARTMADRLLPIYEEGKAYPVFFIWHAGLEDVLPDVLQKNLRAIFQERFFQRLQELVTQYALKKLGFSAPQGLVSLGNTDVWQALPELSDELRSPVDGHEPFASVVPSLLAPEEELSDEEQNEFRAHLEADAVFMREVQVVSQALEAQSAPTGPQGLMADLGAPAMGERWADGYTLVSPTTVARRGPDELAVPQGLGFSDLFGDFFSPAALLAKAITVAVRVIRRFAQSRDHGFYPTIVEEILRAFYLANVGEKIWEGMKDSTANAFGVGLNCGGTAFIEELKALPPSKRRIVLVGHSTGAIYICHLLKKAHEVLPEDVTFDVVLLAPACDFGLLARTIQSYGSRIANLRVFGMRDSLEKNDHLVPLVYPRSLLYFVSGLLEPEVDMPLVGMERYYTGQAPYDSPDILTVLEYLRGAANRSVWSISPEPLGCLTTSRAHGDFDDDPQTLQSLAYILRNSFLLAPPSVAPPPTENDLGVSHPAGLMAAPNMPGAVDAPLALGAFDPEHAPSVSIKTFTDVTQVRTAVSPDSSYILTRDALQEAEGELLLYIYNVSAEHMVELLREAKERGVLVRIMYDRTDSRGDEVTKLQSLGLGDNLREAPSSGRRQGNREWVVRLDHPELAQWFKQLFEEDWDIPELDSPMGLMGGPEVVPADTEVPTVWAPSGLVAIPDEQFECTEFAGPTTVTPVISPVNYREQILKCIQGAQQSIDIQQQYIKEGGPATVELLSAVKAAKERGVQVRIIASVAFRTTGQVDDWERTMRTLANFDLYPCLRADNLRLHIHCHNKGVIVDRRQVVISSTNWSENSISRAREAGVLIESPEIAEYYAKVFDFDWEQALGAADYPASLVAMEAQLAAQPDEVAEVHPSDFPPDN